MSTELHVTNCEYLFKKYNKTLTPRAIEVKFQTLSNSKFEDLVNKKFECLLTSFKLKIWDDFIRFIIYIIKIFLKFY